MRVYLVIHNVTNRQVGGVFHSQWAAELASQASNSHVASRWVEEF